jgi:hypothetical protein
MRKNGLKVAGLSVVMLSATTAAAYTYTTQVTLKFADDVGASANSGTLILGNSTGRQIAIDDNEIQARAANGGPSVIYLQHAGGTTEIGADVVIGGDVDLPANASVRAGGESVLVVNELGNGLPVLHHTAALNIFTGQVRFDTDVVSFESHVDFAGGTNFAASANFAEPATFRDAVTMTSVLSVAPVSVPSGNTMCMATSGAQRLVGYCGSSRRLKTDIKTLQSGLREVMAMRPVSYVWRATGERDLGFIAEETEAIQPELVIKDDNGEVGSFDYQHYTAVLTRAVQEQQGLIDGLRGKLQAERTQFTEGMATRDRELAEQKKRLESQGAQVASLTEQVAALTRSVAQLTAQARP